MATLLGCPIDAALADEAAELINEIRENQGAVDDVGKITAVIAKLTSTSMDYFFTRPVRELGAGRTLLGVVSVTNRGAVKVIRGGMQQVLSRFNEQQILQVADYIEESFYEI